jgi:hypothetical protein
MRQYSPPCCYDGHFGAQPCMRLSFVVEEQYFRLCVVGGTRQRRGFRILSVSIWWSDFTVVSLDKKITRITPSLSQKTLTNFFPADSALLDFLFPGDIALLYFIDWSLDSCSKWWTKLPSPVSICDKKPSPPLSLWRKYQWRLLSLSVCSCQLAWHQTNTELWTVHIFTNCHYTSFTDG